MISCSNYFSPSQIKLWKIIFGAFFTFLLLSCEELDRVKYGDEEIPYSRFYGPPLDQLEVDSLFNSSLFFSGSGLWEIHNDQIILADKQTGLIHVFSDDLEIQDTLLGIGEGPNQVRSSILGLASNGSRLFILGGSYDYYLVDKNWAVSQQGALNFYHEKTLFKELEKNPEPEMAGIYEVHYEYLDPKWIGDGSVIFQISSSHPSFNYLWTEPYFSSARNLGFLDLETGKVEIKGRYPSVYTGKNRLPYSMGTLVADLDKEGYIQSFEADSLMYHVSQDGRVAGAFGIAGQKLDANYSPLIATTVDEYDLRRVELRDKLDFYTSLDFIEELNLLVRGYTKNSQLHDGIQIYRNDSLILDQDVPKGFKFFGYKAPYLYGSDTKQFLREDKVIVYRLKLSL